MVLRCLFKIVWCRFGIQLASILHVASICCDFPLVSHAWPIFPDLSTICPKSVLYVAGFAQQGCVYKSLEIPFKGVMQLPGKGEAGPQKKNGDPFGKKTKQSAIECWCHQRSGTKLSPELVLFI